MLSPGEQKEALVRRRSEVSNVRVQGEEHLRRKRVRVGLQRKGDAVWQEDFGVLVSLL